MNADAHRIAVIGGSLVGLLAGNLLLRAGHDVHVFERTAEDLEGRGAGITVLPGLEAAFQAAGVDETERSLGVELPERLALDRSGTVIAQRTFSQVMTSWSRLYESLRGVFPAERYHRGCALERVEPSDAHATAVFADGRRFDADLLVGADGLRSTVRAQMAPGVRPTYPGYIAWRCLADQRDLPEATFARLMQAYAICVAPGEQAIAYPVPGPDHSIAHGHRQFNVVWYHPVREADELPAFLTDDSGRYHPNGIPPALLSTRVRARMIDTAARVLAPQFAEALARGRLHFFQPILDLEPTQLVSGRIALVGDAAFVIRPHTAMGVPKGAGDVRCLVDALARHGSDVDRALGDFEIARLRVGRAILQRGQRLGAYMQAQGGTLEERARAEAARSAVALLEDTAAPIDYEGIAG